jgi:fibronectin-binding autotransporter adhesin
MDCGKIGKTAAIAGNFTCNHLASSYRGVWRERMSGPGQWLPAGVAALLSFATVGAAQTWTGGGGDFKWSTGLNWSGGIAPANDGTADIVMSAAGNPDSIIDLPWNIHSLTFAPNATTFSLTGSDLAVGEIHNQGGALQNISNNISAIANQIWETNGEIVMSGGIFGTGGLTKTGSGKLTLAGASTYSGGTLVQNGTLAVSGDAAPTGSGDLTIFGGATLTGEAVLSGNVTLQQQAMLAPGNGLGQLVVGGLTLNTGAKLAIQNTPSGLDHIIVTNPNALSILGYTSIFLDNDFNAGRGQYVLIDYNGAPLSDSAVANLHVDNFNGIYLGEIQHDAANTDVLLRVFYWQERPYWYADADGSWREASNWADFNVPDAHGYPAMFLGRITAPRTITLDGNRTVGTLDFDNSNRYTIAPGSGGTLTIDNLSQASVVVVSGSHVISAPVIFTSGASLDIAGGLSLTGGVSIASGKALIKTGAGTLTLAGAQSHGPGASLEVNRGRLNLNSDAGAGGAAGDEHKQPGGECLRWSGQQNQSHP